MSKASRKRRHSRRQAKTHKQAAAILTKQQSKGKFLVFVIVAILAAIPFGLGKYIEFNSPGPFDSASNVYSAKHILEGAKIGVEEQPSAALGTLVVNMAGVWLFGFSEFGPKLLQGLAQAAALVMMFYLMRKLFGTLAAAVGVIIASVYLSAPLIAKYGNVKEQFMIAFLVLGVSCFVLRQLGSGWWLSVLAGGFAMWGTLFKQTGFSAVVAIGLFVIIQPILRHRTWRQTGIDIGLLLTGAILALAPVCIWLLSSQPNADLPHSFAWKPIVSAFKSSQGVSRQKPAVPKTPKTKTDTAPDRVKKKGLWGRFLPRYVRRSWELVKPSERKIMAVRVMRYYGLLILPIALAMGAIVARLLRMVVHWMRGLPTGNKKSYDRFVLLFAVWWLLDMAFIWVSPRPYEQYYLPLNASAAMLGGYLIGLYQDAFAQSIYKGKWVVIGAMGVVCMIAMSWHIFFGLKKSPFSGMAYRQKSRGYAQKLKEARVHRKGQILSWEVVGEYIRQHSVPSDRIYVWGWYPGIYVKAQRFSSARKAFESEMHTKPPKALARVVRGLLKAFKRQPPKFIVDSRQTHFPYDGRPPLELWPILPEGFLGAKQSHFLGLNKAEIAKYDYAWAAGLRKSWGEDEAGRYEAMKPFRDYVMNNYKIVKPADRYLPHVLFERKRGPVKKGQQ